MLCSTSLLLAVLVITLLLAPPLLRKLLASARSSINRRASARTAKSGSRDRIISDKGIKHFIREHAKDSVALPLDPELEEMMKKMWRKT